MADVIAWAGQRLEFPWVDPEGEDGSGQWLVLWYASPEECEVCAYYEDE